MNPIPKILDVVKNNTVKFSHYRAGFLYYNIAVQTHTEKGINDQKEEVDYMRFTDYQFPVPISDTGGATFLAKDKAITYMRYIRQDINDNTFVETYRESGD